MLDFATRAASFGERIAIRAPDVTVTYAQLAARIESARASLSARGVVAYDRVALRCKPSVETISAALALLEQRCVVLPLAGDAPAEALQAPLETFAPAWVVCEGEVAVGVGRASARPMEGGDAPLQALLSSGSSGRPKIVLRSATQVEAGVRIFVAAMRLDERDRVLLLVPLAHSFGFNSLMIGALSSGAEIVLPRSSHPRGIARQIEESRVTLFAAPPLFFDLMHRFADGRRGQLGSVRASVSVGDVLPRATHGRFVDTFEVPLWQSYGASEAGPLLLNQTGAGTDDTLALGRPYPEVEVEIRDENGAPSAEGEIGEITVCSPAVGLGYLGEDGGGSHFAGREFSTGDLGVHRDGEVHFAGRRKLLIARAGRKIDPGEIERVLREHPDVIDAAVRVAGNSGHDPLQAVVVSRRGVDAAELIELCARVLEPHKVPRLIEFRAELPRDGTGKLQRDRL